MTSLINYTPTSSDANTELEVTSTDESVISAEKTNGINIKLIAKKAGTSTITIKPKYNQSSVKTYKVTVYDPLQIDKLEVEDATPKIGEKVQLSAEAQNGSGNLQYKFYEKMKMETRQRFGTMLQNQPVNGHRQRLESIQSM